ncbi:MAG: hypothetical protein ACQEP8_01060 [Chlamydiota bacterium]
MGETLRTEPRTFMLSLPLGFLTTTVLFANEVPDYYNDLHGGRWNLVRVVTLPKAYIAYYILVGISFGTLLLNYLLGFIGVLSLSSLALLFLAYKAGKIIQTAFDDKQALIRSSQITVNLHLIVGIIMILALFI